MRAFVAIEIGDELRSQLAAFQNELREASAQVRWVRPEAMHLTLAFLGETPEPGLAEVQAAMALSTEGNAAFQLDVRGAGTFGRRHAPRILWADLKGDTDAVIALQGRLADALRAAGFETEDRPFAPHITLGRFTGKRNLEAVTDEIARAWDRHFGRINATAVTLFESRLHPEGALHIPHYRAELR